MTTPTTAVYCTKLTETSISFECPYCWVNKTGTRFNSEYFKNGSLSSRVPGIHNHGSNSNYKNRIEPRGSHCPFYKGNFDIIINDNTKKDEPLENKLKVNFD